MIDVKLVGRTMVEGTVVNWGVVEVTVVCDAVVEVDILDRALVVEQSHGSQEAGLVVGSVTMSLQSA